jgi:catechol 2,3-dioxygenase-like lactoylglutathione lyase family enzyme
MSELVPLLNVEDVKQSIRFYEEALGSRVESEWDLDGEVRWARIGFDGGKLMLNKPESVSSAARRKRPEFADAVLYVMCDDAPALRARLVAAGLPVSDLTAEAYGNDEFSVRDPDGYAIRFSSPRS